MSFARRLITSALAETDIEVNGSRPWDPRVHRDRVFPGWLTGGSLALGESYMNGDWDCGDLSGFFHRLTRGDADARLAPVWKWSARLQAKARLVRDAGRVRRVDEVHYDLGNPFYADMLDSRMQYTCAYFQGTGDLETAQERKLDLICRKLRLRSGERVLELGGGWGGFARFAAERYGCVVESYNISKQQVEHAREYCRGLPVTIHHRDYREARGVFDKVVSIGICEHVGRKNYRDFLLLQKERLKDGGLILLHTIGCNHSKTTADPWFTRYIFPGGFLPSLAQLAGAADGLLVTEDLHNFGAHYDLTLTAWHDRFEKAWPRHRDAFGERFRRMWRYYLLSCAGAFRARRLQLFQFVFSQNGLEGGYESVR